MTRDVSVIFDGSTRQGEAVAIIVRFIDDQWAITQRLIRIDVCSKSVNADELPKVLNEALCVEFGKRANSLPAAMRDGASINQAALNRIKFFFPKMLTMIVCFSHTLDNVGSHLMIPALQEFGDLWVRLFHSYRAKREWKNLTARKPNPTAKPAGGQNGKFTRSFWSSLGTFQDFFRRPKHCTATTRLTIRSWVPCQPQAGACRDYWCRGAFCQKLRTS